MTIREMDMLVNLEQYADRDNELYAKSQMANWRKWAKSRRKEKPPKKTYQVRVPMVLSRCEYCGSEIQRSLSRIRIAKRNGEKIRCRACYTSQRYG